MNNDREDKPPSRSRPLIEENLDWRKDPRKSCSEKARDSKDMENVMSKSRNMLCRKMKLLSEPREDFCYGVRCWRVNMKSWRKRRSWV